MLELRELSVRAGGFSLSGVSMTIPSERYGVLMGRTGSGKTTLMEAVCGLKKVTAGAVRLAGQDVTRWRPGERGIGFVPQDTVLFSNMTVYRHFAFGPTLHGWGRKQIEERVQELGEALGVSHLLHREPHGLSGGEGKRVALGRALAAKPRVLCLDEPFSALDEETHGEICNLLKELQRSQGFTTLHITHGTAEAEQLADIRFRLVEGRIERG